MTSFVLKSFSQARQFIYIDPKELLDAKEWIVSWQQRSGAFPPVGKIWNKDIQSGVDGDVALTAYVTVAMIEAGFEREVGFGVKFLFLTDQPIMNHHNRTAQMAKSQEHTPRELQIWV